MANSAPHSDAPIPQQAPGSEGSNWITQVASDVWSSPTGKMAIGGAAVIAGALLFKKFVSPAAIEGVVGAEAALTGEAGANLIRAGEGFKAIERPIDLVGTKLGTSLTEAGLESATVRSNFAGSANTIYEANQRFARINIPSITGLDRSGLPIKGIATIDDTTQLGRVYENAKDPFALVVRMGRTPGGAYSMGSGVAVRSDGLIAVSNHAITDPAAAGEIWVRLPNQGLSFRARIVAQKELEDIALLKPVAPLGPPIRFLSPGRYASGVSSGADLLAVGAPEVRLVTTGGVPTAISGEMYASTGKAIGKGDLVHYLSEPNAFMYRSTVKADYGMSGGAVYDVGSGRFIGAMQAGNDYQWTAITPAEKIRALILRTP